MRVSEISEVVDFRTTLHSSPLALIENSAVSSRRQPTGHERGYQVVLPYSGLFAYNVGRRLWLIDPNRVLCISPGWEFFDEHPVEGIGHAALLLSPAAEIVHEICGFPGPSLNSAFNLATIPSTSRLRMLTHLMLRWPAELDNPLLRDEWAVHALQELSEPRRTQSRASRLIDRAKEALHAHGCERLSLHEIARLVGISPVYLTQEFTRSEGIPLYQYQLRLRMNRALLELPQCENITGLALDLGFSSHSHFTSVFHKSFGLTPSQYRSGSQPIRLGESSSRGVLRGIKSRRAA